jgi:hypothetical protein
MWVCLSSEKIFWANLDKILGKFFTNQNNPYPITESPPATAQKNSKDLSVNCNKSINISISIK